MTYRVFAAKSLWLLLGALSIIYSAWQREPLFAVAGAGWIFVGAFGVARE